MLNKPLLAVDPKLYFKQEMASEIDHGIALRNRNVELRGFGEEPNNPEDAGVPMMNLSPDVVYDRIREDWLEATTAILWG